MVWTRRELLRRSLGVGIALGTGGVLSGCADSVTGTARPARVNVPRSTTTSRGAASTKVKIVVLKSKPYAFTPQNSSGSNGLTGVTVEVARVVLEKIGVDQVEFLQVTALEQVITSMVARQVDMVGGIYLNKSICDSAIWSVPDHVGVTSLAVPPGNPKGLSTFADVVAKGAVVTVMRSLPEEAAVSKAGVPAAKIKALPGPIEMLKAVTDGQADCAAFNDIGLRQLVTDGYGKLDVTPGFRLEGVPPTGVAWGFQKSRKDLVEPFNAELRDLQESGEWLRIAQPFGLSKENVPPAGVTTEQLCTA